MDFRTKIPLSPQQPKIGYDSRIFLSGSCFVENIGKKFNFYQFQTLLNPFGIFFHPAAIANFLQKVESKYHFSEKDIFYHNDQWHCPEAHSSLSSPEKDEILQNLNSKIEESYEFIKKATHLIFTFGTSWSYRNLASGETVANCHKVPQKEFKKELSDPKKDILAIISSVKRLNPDASIIFTISPVRHLKDGFVENQLSKAKLITAVHECLKEQKNLFYFPSYEIMMDELRDYRFYSEDMIHPNTTAIDYIWKRFSETWIAPEAQPGMARAERIQKALSHKAFNEDSEAYKKFQKDLQQKIEDFKKDFPQSRF